MSKEFLIDKIDELLPQTQCGLCGHGACLPYATAIVTKNEAINRCPPGGVETLTAIANLLHKDPSPYLDEMKEKEKKPLIAVIRENECIGCTKCIQACPVDAIIGSAKKMHTVITQECTGCELCLPPCPVDCIDLLPASLLNENDKKNKANSARKRYITRQKRIQNQKTKDDGSSVSQSNPQQRDLKTEIQAALARVHAKKEITDGR